MDILACKRCGKQPAVMVGGIESETKYFVSCERCGKEKETIWADTREQAILEWNDWQSKIPSIVFARIMGAIKEMQCCNLDHDWLRGEIELTIREYLGGE